MKSLTQISPAEILESIKRIDKQTWIKIGAGALGVLGIFVFFIWPAWFGRLGVRSQIHSIETQIATTQSLFLKRPQLVRDKEKMSKFSEEVKGRLFKPGESSLLLGMISKLAEQSKVSVVSSTPRNFDGKFPPPYDTQYEANVYDFTVEGGYHDLAVFVSRIENYPKVLRIQSYHLVPQEKEPDKHLASLSLIAVSMKKGTKP